MLREEWRPVVGYEGAYMVSSAGQVKSLKGKQQRVLKPGLSAGYPFVNLLAGGRQRSCKIHRLVAEAFIDNTEQLDTVNHIDGDKENNRVENLEWASYGTNNSHALYSGLKKQVRAVVAIPVDGPVGYWFASQAKAASYGFHQTSISRVCRGVKNTHHGYKWQFCDMDIEMGHRVMEVAA